MPDSSEGDSILVEQALMLSGESARLDYLNSACDGNEARIKRLLELLKSSQKADSFFETQIEETGDLTTFVAEDPGTRIGRYRLLERIGEGGFGMVYMAEQREPVIRKVALKIIKPGMDTKQVIARFESERQALALMDHPNIAKVFDGGTTESGRPFFVMELVGGIAITEYCDEGALTTNERLILFQEICNAIQHAHQKGIIHRDIKPSNILVTVQGDKPIPKVIDFGIAKATQQRLTEKTLFTQFHQFMGTPAYMSPEQASLGGFDIDTRSDVYSLGVLLYELLVGKTPFDSKSLMSNGYEEIRRIIREDEAPKPSTRLKTLAREDRRRTANYRGAKPEALTMALQGDLDWIVMKALEKDRTRRYGNASNLAEDIRRYLVNEPVSAVAPSSFYKLQKFAARNRTGLTLATAFAIVLITTTAISLLQAHRASSANESLALQLTYTEQARQEAESAKELSFASEQAASRNLEALRIQRGQDLFKKDRADDAVAWLIFAARNNPTSKMLADSIVASLLFTPQPRPLLPPMVHGNQVEELTYSPDGIFLASASRDGVAKLWDARTGEAIGGAIRHQDRISRIRFSPDSALLATASDDGTAAVWRAATAEAFGQPFRHRGKVNDVSFSSDSRYLATASADKNVQVWELSTGQPVGSGLAHTGPVNSVSYGPNGKWIVTGSEDQSAVIWDAVTFARVVVLPHQSAVRQVRFNHDGTLILTSSVSAARIWDPGTGDPITPRLELSRVTAFSFKPQGTHFAGATFLPGRVTLFDIRKGKSVGDPIRHPYNPIVDVEFSPDGQRLVTAGYDDTVRFWDAGTGEPLGPPIKEKTPLKARFSPDGITLAIGSTDGTVTLWDTRPNVSLITGFNHPHLVAETRFRPNSRWFLTGDRGGMARIWDAQTLTLKSSLEFEGTVMGITDFAVSLQGDKALIASGSNRAHIWNIESGTPIGPPLDHPSPVHRGRFSPLGDRLVTGTINGEIKVWDGLSSDPLVATIEGGGHLSGFQFSKDGRRIAAAVANGVEVLDGQTGERLYTPLTHPGRVRGVQFSPDDTMIVSVCDDGFLRFWVTETGVLDGAPLYYGEGSGPKVRFSPDGRALASTSGDNRVHIWDPKTRTLLSPPIQLDYSPLVIHFTPDSRRLLVHFGETLGYLQMWEVASGLPVGPPFGLRDYLYYTDLSSDGRWAVSCGLKGATLYELPDAPTPIPTEFLDFAEAVAGRRIAEDGRTFEYLTNYTTQDLQREFSRPAVQGYYGDIIRWFISDSHERSLTPHSEIMPAAYQDFLLQQGDLKSLEDMLRFNPTNGVAAARIACHYFRNQDQDDRFQRRRGEFYLAHAQRWAGDQADTHLALALSHFSLGKFEQATREAATALGKAPTHPDVWDLKARLAANENRSEEALAAWTQAIVLAHSSDHPRLELFESRRAEWFKRTGRLEELARYQVDRLKIVPRETNIPDVQLDLSLAYNAGFNTRWRHSNRAHLGEFVSDGNEVSGDVPFDARGIVHLYSRVDENRGYRYPRQMLDLAVNQFATRIHVLHSAKHADKNDLAETILARYRLRYADGSSHSFEVKANVHVQDWRFEESVPHHLEANEKLGVVWTGKCHPSESRADRRARLFKTTWTNPFPSKEIATLDLLSAEENAGVFIIAITLE